MWLAAATLLWPALLNGGPFWFPDSSNYIRAADAAFVTIFDAPSEWSDRLLNKAVAAPRLEDERPGSIEGEVEAIESNWKPNRPVLTGRSIYYGAVLYVPMRIFGPWGAIIVQSLIVVTLLSKSLSIIANRTNLRNHKLLAATLVLVIAFSPLPFYTSMLMPDVYSGVLIIVLITLIIFWSELGWLDRTTMFFAASVISLFHTTHILLVVAIAFMCFLLCLTTKYRIRPLLIAAPIVTIALFGEFAFSYAVTARLGEPPISPPFLSARITAAGPGTRYLQTHCGDPTQNFALCGQRAKLPQISDNFLWSTDKENGVFQLADSTTQRLIAQEDKTFFLAVVAAYPAEVLATSALATFRQIGSFGLGDFNYSIVKREIAEGKYPPNIRRSIERSLSYHRQMPILPIVILTLFVSVCSAVLVLRYSFAPAFRVKSLATDQHRHAMLVFLAILANAAICGAISKPGARYQMRMIWLLPIAASTSRLASMGEKDVGRINPRVSYSKPSGG
jgi:hypothetical protein